MNAKDTTNLTALHFAASEGRLEIVKLLLEQGADVNAKDIMNLTALHCAALEGHLAVVTLLLAKGADVKVKALGMTPLDMAIRQNHTYVVAEFVKVVLTKVVKEVLFDRANSENIEDLIALEDLIAKIEKDGLKTIYGYIKSSITDRMREEFDSVAGAEAEAETEAEGLFTVFTDLDEDTVLDNLSQLKEQVKYNIQVKQFDIQVKQFDIQVKQSEDYNEYLRQELKRNSLFSSDDLGKPQSVGPADPVEGDQWFGMFARQRFQEDADTRRRGHEEEEGDDEKNLQASKRQRT